MMEEPAQPERKRGTCRPNTTCDLCSKPIYRAKCVLAVNAGKFCSRACRNRAHPCFGNAGPRMKGERNPAWRGGVSWRRAKGNYVGGKYVRCPTEFLQMARKDGYVAEHRLVMAKSLQRLLLPKEVVHHIDHNPRNNALENLMLFASNSEHKRFEGQESQAANPVVYLFDQKKPVRKVAA